MQHASQHFKEDGDGTFGDSVLFWTVGIRGFMDNAITLTEIIHCSVDKFGSTVSSNTACPDT